MFPYTICASFNKQSLQILAEKYAMAWASPSHLQRLPSHRLIMAAQASAEHHALQPMHIDEQRIGPAVTQQEGNKDGSDGGQMTVPYTTGRRAPRKAMCNPRSYSVNWTPHPKP